MRDKQLPTGRFARLSRMARVGARSGLSLLGATDSSAAAEQALELLGNLRGLAAKVGQLASYVDGIVPAAHSETYQRVLSGLQAATAASSFESVRAVVERELGKPLAEAFAEFEEKPLASASIGQVHRARLPNGQEVAVKVQHQGIEAAFDTDLTGAGALVGFASLIAPRGMDVREVHSELAERLREELDYELEAARQTEFARLFAGETHIHVPQVIAAYTTRRVLTSELVRGRDFASVLTAPEALRRHYAEVLWRFVFTSTLVHGKFNADPHPGNYIFHDDGRITFLDFGSVQPLDTDFRDGARAMHVAAYSCDEAAFRRAAARVCLTKPGRYETDLLTYLWQCFEPLKHSPYTITREYVTRIVQSTQDMRHHMLDKHANITTPPRGTMLMNRVQFGFYSILARLDVAVDYAALDRAILGDRPHVG